MILIPFVWVGYIWSRIKDPHRELDYIPEPENKIVRFFFKTSNRVSSSWLLRTFLYLLISLLVSTFAIIDVVKKDIFYFLYGAMMLKESLVQVECTPEVCTSPWV
jgi:hypothetical protein